MRKLKIYDGTRPDTPINLRLVSDGEGGVSIAAVDAKGGAAYSGYLVTINAEGFLEILNNISSDHGFPLDSDRRLKLGKVQGKTQWRGGI